METTKPGVSNVAIKWAVFNILVSIIVTYVFQFSNIDASSPIRYLAFIPFIAFLFLAQKEYRDQLGGFMTFGEGFLPGFLFSVYAGILGSIFIYVYYTFLSPQVYGQVLATMQTAMEAKGLSSDKVDAAMDIYRKHGIVITAIVGVFGSALVGAIIALIGAAIFKKERSPFDVKDDSYTDPVS